MEMRDRAKSEDNPNSNAVLYMLRFHMIRVSNKTLEPSSIMIVEESALGIGVFFSGTDTRCFFVLFFG